jgi:hypothetical protein
MSGGWCRPNRCTPCPRECAPHFAFTITPVALTTSWQVLLRSADPSRSAQTHSLEAAACVWAVGDAAMQIWSARAPPKRMRATLCPRNHAGRTQHFVATSLAQCGASLKSILQIAVGHAARLSVFRFALFVHMTSSCPQSRYSTIWTVRRERQISQAAGARRRIAVASLSV